MKDMTIGCVHKDSQTLSQTTSTALIIHSENHAGMQTCAVVNAHTHERNASVCISSHYLHSSSKVSDSIWDSKLLTTLSLQTQGISIWAVKHAMVTLGAQYCVVWKTGRVVSMETKTLYRLPGCPYTLQLFGKQNLVSSYKSWNSCSIRVEETLLFVANV